MTADTLTYNARQIAEWHESGDYEYNNELVGLQQNLLEWLMNIINRFLDKLFSGVSYETKVALYIIGSVAILLLVLWLIYKVKPNLFRRDEKTTFDYREVEDTIYGIDFAKDISAAKERGDWFETVRLVYLATLKNLSDTGRIVWQPWKTPLQYTYEMNDEFLGKMTMLFVKIRYGKYDAGEDDVRNMEKWQQLLKSADTGKKGGGYE
ncbi:DUF4129 domain-containing protein [Prevotella sp. OH937_COT-195]|uniref:DUF4129 domain-containing protein n=1 Tax=Prevotella sp. OH937_COT-195 TaxID=2491051 RepID=UPI000F64CBBF|nr:DUF4129 domain-containing protein [Prevotella sp. OH937_COT-195]RRD02924.1 DUF4129 domain-containing protein [Prevotella sp. OH937_COT-195]